MFGQERLELVLTSDAKYLDFLCTHEMDQVIAMAHVWSVKTKQCFEIGRKVNAFLGKKRTIHDLYSWFGSEEPRMYSENKLKILRSIMA